MRRKFLFSIVTGGCILAFIRFIHPDLSVWDTLVASTLFTVALISSALVGRDM